MQPGVKAVLLPIRFDPACLQADYAAIGREEWVTHFNTSYFQGDWSGVALRLASDAFNPLCPSPSANSEGYRDTELRARCPHLHAVLTSLQCPLRSARILKLSAGSVIREHSDEGLGWEEGEVRLHVPIHTNPQVEFYIEDRRIVMNEGDCWYLDLGRPHRVQNRGTTDRLHLVIDCQLNDWLRALVESGQPMQGTQNNFHHFRERVQQDAALHAELAAVPATEFLNHITKLGTALGFEFLPGDVEAELNSARRRWLERGVR